MKLSLRNVAMGAALAVSSFAFAQEAPFTVTTNFNRLMTGADFGVTALGGDVRTATGVNGKMYALDKGTGKIWEITADAVTEYRTIPVYPDENAEPKDRLMLDITADDAGNLLVAYANGDFFANSLKTVAIVPADGSDLKFVDLEFPEGWSCGRVDGFGRITGDMLSADGAYFYLTGAGGGTAVACYWVHEGQFDVESNTSDAYKTAGASLTYAFPRYNTVAEMDELEYIYNGGVLAPWNGSGLEVIADGECTTIARPEGLAYSSVPGGEVLNYNGKTYWVIPYTTVAGKRSGDFVIYDEAGAIVFKTENGAEGGLMADLVNTGSFIQGGGIYAHPIADHEGAFQLFYWGGFNQGAIAAYYVVDFTGTYEIPDEPEEPAVAPRAAMAYDLQGVQEGTKFEISYKASADAAYAALYLTNVENAEDVYGYELPTPKAGLNTFTFEADEDLPGGEYNWTVVLSNENDAEEPSLVFYKNGDNAIQWGRGGLVTITDSEYDSYGYTVVANSRGLGLDLYNPEGEFVGNYKPESFTSPAGNSCPLRGDQRGGKAIFASWGDANSGIYSFDPLNPTENVKQLVLGDREASGAFTYNGVKTLGGTPTVCFTGKGEETMMWTFDEDVVKNTVLGFPVGNAEEFGVPASIICNTENAGWNSTGLLASTVPCFEPTSHGVFAAQNRANGMDPDVPAFVFFGLDGQLLAKSLDLFLAADFTMPSCNGAIAINKEEEILAIGSYDAVHFFYVDWTEDTPALEHLYDVAIPVSTNFSQAKFDAANNLHIAGVKTQDYYTTQFYAVIALPGANTAATPAKSANTFNNTSGVEGVAVDADAADAVYYNLNGVRVAAEDLTPGVYVKVAGKTATKVVIK